MDHLSTFIESYPTDPIVQRIVVATVAIVVVVSVLKRLDVPEAIRPALVALAVLIRGWNPARG